MKINNKQLLSLPVVTTSGQLLGKICGWELDIDTHKIIRYEVKSNSFVAQLFTKTLLIAVSQVVSVSLDKMVVEDNIVKFLDPNKKEKTRPLKDASSISMLRR